MTDSEERRSIKLEIVDNLPKGPLARLGRVPRDFLMIVVGMMIIAFVTLVAIKKQSLSTAITNGEEKAVLLKKIDKLSADIKKLNSEKVALELASNQALKESSDLRAELAELKKRDGNTVLWVPTVEDIKFLQMKLDELGFNPGKIDGKLGENTRAAMQEFQRRYGLSVTQGPSKETLAKLREK